MKTKGCVNISVAVVCASLTACGASVKQEPGNAPSSLPASVRASASASPSNAPLTGSIGSTFQVTDDSNNVYTITLTKVIDPAHGSDQFNSPDNGMRFVAAVFTLTGKSGTATDDANSNAVITGDNSQQYQPDFNTIAGYTNFDDGQFHLTPGQSVTGAVNFQVPTGISVRNIQWSPMLGQDTATWKVGK